MRIADVPQHVFDFGGGTVGIEQGVDFFDEFAAAVTQFERFRIAVRNEHQRNVRITRNILPELQQVTVDLGLLFGRIVGSSMQRLTKLVRLSKMWRGRKISALGPSDS